MREHCIITIFNIAAIAIRPDSLVNSLSRQPVVAPTSYMYSGGRLSSERASHTAASNRPVYNLFSTTTIKQNHQTTPKLLPQTTATTSPSLPTENTIMSSSKPASRTLKMAARFKALGFSYAAVVGTVPSSSGGPDITTDSSVANEENDPSGAVRNGYAFSRDSCCFRRGRADLLASPRRTTLERDWT